MMAMHVAESRPGRRQLSLGNTSIIWQLVIVKEFACKVPESPTGPRVPVLPGTILPRLLTVVLKKSGTRCWFGCLIWIYWERTCYFRACRCHRVDFFTGAKTCPSPVLAHALVDGNQALGSSSPSSSNTVDHVHCLLVMCARSQH